MSETTKIPFYAKTALIFISLFAFVYTMSIAQNIVIPIVYATIIAILLNPFVNFLCRRKINRLVAIIIAVIIGLCLVALLFYVVITQAMVFSESLPYMTEKFSASSSNFVHWLSDKTNISESKINNWLSDTQSDEMSKLEVGKSITKVGNIIVTMVLLPVYMVMILYYKPLLLDFIRRLFRLQDHSAVEEVLAGSKKIIQSYLVGLSIEMIIVAVLNSLGLLLIGIDYAILLGVIGALLNIIPYLGAIIAATIFMFIALLTKTPIFMLYVLIMYLFIQFIDNNFLIPKVVAARVKINALVSIVVVIIGGTIWGVPGMFLAIPLTAIVKVIFDHIEPLKPWGFLLGDIVPTTPKYTLERLKKKLRGSLLPLNKMKKIENYDEI
jgi:predicted PurR-regulated permease PerM